MLIACSAIAADHVASPPGGLVSPARVDEIAGMLDDAPMAFGPPIEDREGWQKLAKTEGFSDVVRTAEASLTKPLPAMTEEIYGEYLASGQRTKHYSEVRTDRYTRIANYTLAECIENKGRFIKPLEDVIRSVCEEPTWTYNFHDPKLDFWKKRHIYVDLGAFIPAQDMAEASGLLKGKLDPALRKLIAAECTRRILDPYRAAVNGEDNSLWWMNGSNNWNAVCTFGVIGTALTVDLDKHDRAFFLAAAEKHISAYLDGFEGDGYCAEGMGYWSYGFGHFLLLAEAARQATRDKLDIFDLPGARLASMYPARITIVDDVSPAFADCGEIGGSGGILKGAAKPIFTFAARRYQTGIKQWQVDSPAGRGSTLVADFLMSLPNAATTMPNTAPASYPPDPLRDYFKNGVLICRPNPGGDFGAAIKGGNNDESHNHNDLGTFVVVQGGQPLILDPGGSVYDATTFSAHRYDNPMLSSYGHPVPRLAGQLQRPGKNAVAKVLSTDFKDDRDDIELDLTSAYSVKSLQSFHRGFSYVRGQDTVMRITDMVTFDSPQAYESAVITYGEWKQNDDGSLLIWQKGQAVRVTIETQKQAKWNVSAEKFGPNKIQPTRISIALIEPTANPAMTLSITPAKAP